MAMKDKPHGPVSEQFMRHHYGAAKPAPTAHPESYGHWDHAQISEMLRARDVLEKRLRAIVLWLEQNQPDVFRRGIWDAIGEVENGND